MAHYNLPATRENLKWLIDQLPDGSITEARDALAQIEDGIRLQRADRLPNDGIKFWQRGVDDARAGVRQPFPPVGMNPPHNVWSECRRAYENGYKFGKENP